MEAKRGKNFNRVEWSTESNAAESSYKTSTNKDLVDRTEQFQRVVVGKLVNFTGLENKQEARKW